MVWNFGMGAQPFTALRQASQAVSSYNGSEWNDFDADWQRRLIEEMNSPVKPQISKEYLPTFQWSNEGRILGGPWAPKDASGVSQFIDGWRSDPFGPDDRTTTFGHDSGGVYQEIATPGRVDLSRLYSERAAKEAEFAAAQDRNARQQQAYSQQLGGGFTGGLINGSYSNPFAGQITGVSSSDPSMPWSQSWATPGFGGGSAGGYSPNGTGQSAPSNTGGQGGGWGGPFSNRNPWSLG